MACFVWSISVNCHPKLLDPLFGLPRKWFFWKGLKNHFEQFSVNMLCRILANSDGKGAALPGACPYKRGFLKKMLIKLIIKNMSILPHIFFIISLISRTSTSKIENRGLYGHAPLGEQYFPIFKVRKMFVNSEKNCSKFWNFILHVGLFTIYIYSAFPNMCANHRTIKCQDPVTNACCQLTIAFCG